MTSALVFLHSLTGACPRVDDLAAASEDLLEVFETLSDQHGRMQMLVG